MFWNIDILDEVDFNLYIFYENIKFFIRFFNLKVIVCFNKLMSLFLIILVLLWVFNRFIK